MKWDDASNAEQTRVGCCGNLPAHDATEHSLGVMLDLIDSQITYRSRYLVGMALAPVRDMALLDPFNPRSVAFQVNRIDEGIGTLPTLRRDGMLEEPRRLTTLLRAELTAERAELIDDAAYFGDRARTAYVGKCDRRQIFPARSRSRPRGENYGLRVIYEITHLTRYSYGAIVELTTGVLRLAPRSGDGQEVERFSIITHPVSQPLTERLDPFGNRVTSLRIEKPHRQLSITASSRVRVNRAPRRREVRPGRASPPRRSR